MRGIMVILIVCLTVLAFMVGGDSTNWSGGYSATDSDYCMVNIDNSMYQTVYWSINDSPYNITNYTCIEGTFFVYGEEVTR